MSFRSSISLHIAIFDCDTPVPNVLALRGFYSDIFGVLLRDAAKTKLETKDVNLEFSRYDCVTGKLPSFENLGLVDGIVITGSGTCEPSRNRENKDVMSRWTNDFCSGVRI
jgi:hypothetical protein